MVQQGVDPQVARDSIKLRWAINRKTGAEVGNAPEETKAAAREFWTAVDNGLPVHEVPVIDKVADMKERRQAYRKRKHGSSRR